MGEQINFRPLTANEIECRVGNVAKNGSGFFLLLYKNARVDANILDETFGVFNWQKRFYQVKNTMVCEILINANYKEPDKEPRWIAKADGGDDDTQMEQVKSELSDSFKRASFCVGVGRELYYSPKIWVNASGDNTTSARYSVKVIEYDDKKRITRLVIINDKTKEVVFLFGKEQKTVQNGENAQKTPTPSADEPKGSIDKNDLKTIQAYIAAFKSETSRTKFYNWLDKTYGTMNPETLTLTQGNQVLKMLSRKGNN